jgi:hypothetical protein
MVCNELENLPSNGNDLLKLMWKTMQEDKIERERIRRKTEENMKGIEGRIGKD